MYRLLPWLLLLWLPGCVRLGFSSERPAPGADAALDTTADTSARREGGAVDNGPAPESTPDLAPPDATADLAPPDGAADLAPSDLAPPADTAAGPLSSFSAPTAVTALNGGGTHNEDPSLTADMLEIYFSRGQIIMRATRATTKSAWSAPAPVQELNQGGAGTADVSASGLTIYFSSLRQGAGAKGGSDIYVATRTSRSALWSNIKPVAALNTKEHDFDAAVTPDEKTIVWAAGGTSTSYDLYVSQRSTTAALWGAPALLAGTNSNKSDTAPWLHSGGKVLYFASTRAGGVGPRSLWVTTRSSASGSFAPPTLVKGLTSSGDDQDPWLSTDLKTIYFASDRGGANLAIYMATR